LSPPLPVPSSNHAQSKVSNEKNRPLADALYELADFVLHGDTLQKGLSYQKAAKSVREAKQPIQSKEAAKKLAGVGKSVGDKIDEFVTKGKIQVLEEYRSGQRGK
jgi:DNA polymerase/3'-5' exonuclease PolX